jgi:hypothetical protein
MLASLGSQWWQHMILRSLATELQSSGSNWFEKKKTILISMIQLRPSDPSTSFKMGKDNFRPKSGLQ